MCHHNNELIFIGDFVCVRPCAKRFIIKNSYNNHHSPLHIRILRLTELVTCNDLVCKNVTYIADKIITT